jgi:2-phosphosulfolactate phosphatase
MEIRINEFIQGAKKAEGLTVIIDVFRAFSVACYAFDGGVRRIIDVRKPSEAFELRENFKNETFLAGEREEKIIEGFDAGNSPTEIITSSLNGKTMIHTTTAGTNGICNAMNATHILGASLVNASATARYIKQLSPAIVTLVAMGYRAECSADEDLLCARYIRDLLNGLNPDIRSEIDQLRTGSGSRFFDPANVKHSPPTDFFLCTDLNRFDFALKAVVSENGYAEIFKIEVK